MTLAIGCLIALQSGVLAHSTIPASHLMTEWGKKVTAQNVHPEYPRPQMVRPDWTNLNGTWDLAFIDKDGKPVETTKILVPFPVESQLSGVGKEVPEGQSLLYRRKFTKPKGERVLLHFGASDWDTTVLVNGKVAGTHEGGFCPFSLEISDLLKPDGVQDLIVAVTDPTDGGPQPRGKQVRKPEGIYYTPTTGIWQTVWLEGLPASFIGELKTTPILKTGVLDVVPNIGGETAGMTCQLEVIDNGKLIGEVSAEAGKTLSFKVENPKPWAPETPFLYNFRVNLKDASGKTVDTVSSYCGFREISMIPGKNGQPMAALNGQPIFIFGPLDQGFWPDGLFTPPSDEALLYDIKVTKELGFNTIRKHVKVESSRFYYYCDKMGLLVMQDMPSGDKSISPQDPDMVRTPDSAEMYYNELGEMMHALHNHPSIICWVPFNEGWGQFDTEKVTDLIRKEDPTRLVDSTTGWSDRGVGDFNDVHIYPGPGAPPIETKRGSLLGEFGGLGFVTPGHTWQAKGWGYKSYDTEEELMVAFEKMMAELHTMRYETGLSGAIYTQTTDVETELNGLLTYDRAKLKFDKARLTKAIKSVYLPASK